MTSFCTSCDLPPLDTEAANMFMKLWLTENIHWNITKNNWFYPNQNYISKSTVVFNYYQYKQCNWLARINQHGLLFWNHEHLYARYVVVLLPFLFIIVILTRVLQVETWPVDGSTSEEVQPVALLGGTVHGEWPLTDLHVLCVLTGPGAASVLEEPGRLVCLRTLKMPPTGTEHHLTSQPFLPVLHPFRRYSALSLLNTKYHVLWKTPPNL